ncbi:hypothetical protein CCACVL1_27584 [Corchorus capsularis]|uniref:Uncharacterized protein n=1 Tax=Corchorus capsularis TaxID=210143 RepID=A0A1R3G9J9_COCAP|nr:hypothetical protein CCACVL1_27584 [Corchorus capsularis]
MEFPKTKIMTMILGVVLIISLFTPKFGAAVRPLHEKEQTVKKIVLDWESKIRGPVTPSGGSSCSNTPQDSGVKCELNEMNFAGRRLIRSPPPPPFPTTIDIV